MVCDAIDRRATCFRPEALLMQTNGHSEGWKCVPIGGRLAHRPAYAPCEALVHDARCAAGDLVAALEQECRFLVHLASSHLLYLPDILPLY
jgi:hypothetical protein